MRVELGFLLLELGEFWRLVIHSQEHINGVFRAGEELNMSRNYDDQLLLHVRFFFFRSLPNFHYIQLFWRKVRL